MVAGQTEQAVNKMKSLWSYDLVKSSSTSFLSFPISFSLEMFGSLGVYIWMSEGGQGQGQTGTEQANHVRPFAAVLQPSKILPLCITMQNSWTFTSNLLLLAL